MLNRCFSPLSLIAIATELVKDCLEHPADTGVMCHKDAACGVVAFIGTRMVIIELVIILILNIASATILKMYDLYVLHVNRVWVANIRIKINKRPVNSVQLVSIKIRMYRVDVNHVSRDSTKIQIHKLRK